MHPIVTPDGHAVPLTVEVRDEPEFDVVMCHGITTHQDEHEFLFTRVAHRLVSLPARVIRFDFRGHGLSAWPPQSMTIEGETTDLSCVLDEVAKTSGEREVVILAASFGAVPTMELAVSRRFRAIILWNPVLDVRRTFVDPGTEWSRTGLGNIAVEGVQETRSYSLDGFPLGYRLVEEMAGREPFPALHSPPPVLIVHGDKDDLVPLEITRGAASEIFGERYELRVIEGVGHGFEDRRDEVMELTLSWLRGCLHDG